MWLCQIAISTSDIDVTEWKGDILAVGLSSSDLEKDESGVFKNEKLRKLDEFLKGILGAVITEEDFKGKPGQSTSVRLPGFGFKRIGLVGIEASGSTSSSKWKAVGESIAAMAKTVQASTLAVTLASSQDLPEESLQGRARSIAIGIILFHSLSMKSNEFMSFMAVKLVKSCLLVYLPGAILGSHEDFRFKAEKKVSSLKSLELIGFGNDTELQEKIQIAKKISQGIIFSKELVNAPPNVLTPSMLAYHFCKIFIIGRNHFL